MIDEKDVELEINFDVIFSNCTFENITHIYNHIDKLLIASYSKRVKELTNIL